MWGGSFADFESGQFESSGGRHCRPACRAPSPSRASSSWCLVSGSWSRLAHTALQIVAAAIEQRVDPRADALTRETNKRFLVVLSSALVNVTDVVAALVWFPSLRLLRMCAMHDASTRSSCRLTRLLKRVDQSVVRVSDKRHSNDDVQNNATLKSTLPSNRRTA